MDARDITAVDEAAWSEAVARANVLRRLAGQERLSRAVVLEACQEVAFWLRDNRARPVCARCEGGLEGRRGEGDGSTRDLPTALLAMQARIAATVDHAPAYRNALEDVIAALWAPLDDPGASRPVLALWISERGWRPPAETRLTVGWPMPLGLLRVPFRGLTLVAIRDLFGDELAALESARERADWLFRRAAFPRPQIPSASDGPAGRGSATSPRL